MSKSNRVRAPLAARLRRWWRREVVGDINHAEIAARIDDDADWSLRYLFMTIMSAGIAILGLLQSSPAVVIGAMLISPLMGPIIGLGFALAVFDWREVRTSLTALALGSLVGVSIAALIVLASPLQGVTSEILARTRPNLFDLLVAIFSALAGTYATVRGQGATVVGVAIATALMPPLAVVGYGLATLNLAIFGGALALYLTNFIAIALTAALMARLYGFAQDLTPRQTRSQTVLIIGVFAVLAVPLAFTLRQIAKESIVSRQLRTVILAQLPSGSRISQLDIEHGATPANASAVVITPRYTASAEALIGKAWQKMNAGVTRFSLSQLVANQDLPRLQDEREALVEAGRANENKATATGLAEAVALVTGTPEAEISIYPKQRRLVANARPGIALATLFATERALEARHPDWQIRLIPSPSTTLSVQFAPGSAEPLDLANVQWALTRWKVSRTYAIGRIASRDDGPPSLAKSRADAVAQALTAADIFTTSMTDLPGPIQRAAERKRGVDDFRTVTVSLKDPALP